MEGSSSTFIWNGNHIIHEQEDGMYEKLYMWGLDGKLLGMRIASSYFVAYGYDGNKNVTDVVPFCTSYSHRYEYDAFGNETSSKTGFGPYNPFRFSSEYVDNETGWSAYKYRYYSPQIGRFLSRDPIAERGGLNLYGFVGNNPLCRTDQFGLDFGDFINWIGKNAAYPEEDVWVTVGRSLASKSIEKKNNIISRFSELSCIEKGLIDLIEGGGFNHRFYSEKAESWWKSVVIPAHEYYLSNYPNYDDYIYEDLSVYKIIYGQELDGINWGPYVPFSKPCIDINLFLYGDRIRGIDTMLHEPQHDRAQRGPGHVDGDWGEQLAYALNVAIDIAQDTSVDEECCNTGGSAWVVNNAWKKILCKCGLKDDGTTK